MSFLYQPSEIIQDKYQIVDILGKGGVAITYKAIDRSTNSPVAIKVISLKQLDDWKQVELFQREAEVLKQLDHPAIPQYIDYFDIETETDKAFYLVQEIAPGKSLFQLVESGWRTNEKEVKHIAQQVLAILQYLHSLDPPVIHRDLKPGNIIRDDEGKIYLVDFGAVQNTYYNTLMQGSTVVGTYGYMSPEQFRGQALPATDLYSLGATLLYLLTHRSPAELPQDTLKLDFRSAVDISESFADWLDKILEPDIDDRFSNAEVALVELNKSQKKKQRKFITSVSAIVLLIGLLAGFNSYKWFFLGYLGFYPSDLCDVEIEASYQEFFQQGGKINFININNIQRDKSLMWCLLNKKLNEGNLDTAQLIIDRYPTNLQLDTHLSYWLGDTEIVNFILKNNAANPNATDDLGNTPLFYTARHKYLNHVEWHSELPFWGETKQRRIKPSRINSYKVAKLLIEAGANVNSRNHLGETPLFAAVKKKDIEIVKLLIQHNADINIKDNKGNTAILNGNPEIVELLIKNGAEISASQFNTNPSILHQAIAQNQTYTLKWLIDSDIQIDLENEALQKLLIDAIKNGYEHIVSILIENSINFDIKNDFSKIILFNAIESEQINIVKLLLDRNVNIDATDNENRTALLIAINQNSKNIAKLIIKNNADVNAPYRSKKNNTPQYPVDIPLIEAINKNQQDIVELLIARGADVNAVNKHQMTPLLQAVKTEQKSIVELLIENKADINVKDKNGSTALLNTNNKDIAKLLIKYGADVNARDGEGNTFLIKNRDKETVILALKHGANINAINQFGRTPLFNAIENAAISGGDPELIQLLIDNDADSKYLNYEIFSKIHTYAKYFEEKIEKFLKENKFKKD